MYVPEKLKINRFKEVKIPRKRDYFMTGRYVADKGVYGGEDTAADVAGERKTETAQHCLEDIANFEQQQ